MRLELSWAKPPVSWMFFNSPQEQRCASAAPTCCRELWWVQPGIALAHTRERETKAGAQGLEARGFARSTMGLGLCCPLASQIIPSYSCTSQADDKSSAPGIGEAFGWVPPSLSTSHPLWQGCWWHRYCPPRHKDHWRTAKSHQTIQNLAKLFHVLLIILLRRVSWWVSREGLVGLWSYSFKAFLTYFFTISSTKGLRFFFCIAFDLVHFCSRFAALAKALLKNFLHLQFTAKHLS